MKLGTSDDAPETSTAPASEDVGIARTTRVLHWTSALLLASAFGLAWRFAAIGPSPAAAGLIQVHRSVGLSIYGVTALRVFYRIAVPLPPLPGATPRWERWLAGTVQVALYVALLAMPLAGWFGSSADGDDVSFLGLVSLPALTEPDADLADLSFRIHRAIGTAILALAGLHVAGALRHHLLHRDAVLERMVGLGHRDPCL